MTRPSLYIKMEAITIHQTGMTEIISCDSNTSKEEIVNEKYIRVGS